MASYEDDGRFQAAEALMNLGMGYQSRHDDDENGSMHGLFRQAHGSMPSLLLYDHAYDSSDESDEDGNKDKGAQLGNRRAHDSSDFEQQVYRLPKLSCRGRSRVRNTNKPRTQRKASYSAVTPRERTQDSLVNKPTCNLNLQPATYDGISSWEEEFKEDFENCAEVGKWGATLKPKMLVYCLRGKARTFYWSLPTEVKSNYGMSVEALSKRYGCYKKKEKFQTELNERRRKANESVSELADEIRTLTVKAYPSMPQMAKDEIAYNAFKQAVDRELRIKFLDRGYHDMDDAVTVAEQYEAIKGSFKAFCFTCGQEGHIARNCRNNATTTSMYMYGAPPAANMTRPMSQPASSFF